MWNYTLLFMSRNGADAWQPVYRTIAAAGDELARRIGYAMAGERFAPKRRLDVFVWALRTEDQPAMGPTCHRNILIWMRILKKIGMRPDTIRFVYSYHIGLATNPQGHVAHVAQSEPEIVGFFPWPASPTHRGGPTTEVAL